MDISETNNKLCRLCLNKKGVHSIFSGKSTIAKKLQSYCALQLHKNDGLPECICGQCISSLNRTVIFIERCTQNDKLLRRNTTHNQECNTPNAIIKKEEPTLFHYHDDINQKSLQALSFDNNSVKIEEVEVEIENSIKNTSLTVKKEKCLVINPDDSNDYHDFFGENEKNKPLKLKKATLSVHSLCPHCGKVFKSTSLSGHLKTHINETNSSKIPLGKLHSVGQHEALRQYPCEVCGKLYKSKFDARVHNNRVHKKIRAVSCKVCNKQLSNRQALQMHMKTHTGEKEFRCEICKRTFFFQFNLTVHLRVHTGEKPYSCKFCDSKFSIPKTLREHERIHTGETPYSCPVCSKGFSQQSNMKSHFRNNHKDIDFHTVYNKSKSKK